MRAAERVWVFDTDQSPQMLSHSRDVRDLTRGLAAAEAKLAGPGSVEALRKAQWTVDLLRTRLKAAEATAPVPFTRAELEAARVIRTVEGWHRVARVHALSVTVKTGHTFTTRFPLAQVLEVRS